MVDARPDGWFRGQIGPSTSAEEAALVAAQLATPSDDATGVGLPVRRSRAHLVPGAFEPPPVTEAARRSAEEIRDRFRGYRSGLRRSAEDG